jgi:hypothetical protein
MKPTRTPPATELPLPPLPDTVEACHVLIGELWAQPPCPHKAKNGRKLGAAWAQRQLSHDAALREQVDQEVLCAPYPQCPVYQGEVVTDERKPMRP